MYTSVRGKNATVESNPLAGEWGDTNFNDQETVARKVNSAVDQTEILPQKGIKRNNTKNIELAVENEKLRNFKPCTVLVADNKQQMYKTIDTLISRVIPDEGPLLETSKSCFYP